MVETAGVADAKDMRLVTRFGPRNGGIARTLAHALRGAWTDSDGIALALSLLVMGVLTIATAAVITASTSNEHAFGRDRQVNRALNIAEAGLNAGVDHLRLMSVQESLGDDSVAGDGNVDQGGFSYTATRSENLAELPTDPEVYKWTVESTGTSPDGNVTRIVSTTLSETITNTSETETTTTPASDAYGYGMFLGDGDQACEANGTGNNVFGNSAQIAVDVYVKGDLCVSGGGSPIIAQPAGTHDTVTVYIGGFFKTLGNASPIGKSTEQLHSATIVKGCIGGSNGGNSSRRYPQPVQCSQTPPSSAPTNCQGSSCGSGVWATLHTSTQNDIAKPVIDTNWYTNAQPGPSTGCGPGSTYPQGWTAAQFKSRVLDNDSTRNTSVGTVNLLHLVDQSSGSGGTAHNSFDCRWYDGQGNLVGQLKWDYPAGCGNNPANGVADLIIDGTVFIDGNLAIGSCDLAVYQGRGTIYVNGTVSFANGGRICAKPVSGSPCAGNYDPGQNLLEIVAVNAGNLRPAFTMSGAGTYEGVAFMNGVFNGANGSILNGVVIADQATMSGDADFQTTVNPPSGAPGAGETTTTTTEGAPEASWTSVPGSWQQLK